MILPISNLTSAAFCWLMKRKYPEEADCRSHPLSLAMATGGFLETAQLFQRLSVALQHFNRVLFQWSFDTIIYDDEDFV